MNHVRPPGRIAEAAFFFPKLCFAPREGENAADLRQKKDKRNGVENAVSTYRSFYFTIRRKWSGAASGGRSVAVSVLA